MVDIKQNQTFISLWLYVNKLLVPILRWSDSQRIQGENASLVKFKFDVEKI